MSTANNHVWRNLHVVRRQIRLQLLLESLVRATLAAGAFLVALGAVNRWVLDRLPWDHQLAPWVAMAILGLALMMTFLRRIPLKAVASWIDRIAGTRDRFISALAFSGDHGTAMERLALKECSAFIQGRDFHSLIRLRPPAGTGWLLIPMVSLVFLQLGALTEFDLRKARQIAGRNEAALTLRQLEEFAAEIAKKAEATDDETLKKVAQKIRQHAAELRTEATDKGEASKAALRQLSALEQLVQDLQKQPPGITPEEIKALAEALQQNDLTREAAAALEAGKLAEAAKALDEASKKNEPSAEQAAELLKEAVQRMAEKKERASEAMRQLSREMQQPGDAKTRNALERLARLLRQTPSRGESSRGGQQQQQLTKQALQELLSQLQNLKYADGKEAARSGKGGEGKEAPVSIESFEQKNAGTDAARIASGQPGSEQDHGTTESPLGEKNEAQREKGADTAVRGRLGEGESLSTLKPAGGDQDQATRRSKELYEAMAPDAQNAVMQEEIPLGSRVFIKRYFEAIRP
ncbi:MAG: hypothetical protein V4710_23720 [Verrucomicrobiota bacterium]